MLKILLAAIVFLAPIPCLGQEIGTYLKKGAEWRAKGDLDKAIAEFDEAIRIDPMSAVAYMHRGSAWYDNSTWQFNGNRRRSNSHRTTRKKAPRRG